MIVKLACGCRIDDAVMSTTHWSDGKHYPIGTSPSLYCKRCDLFRPCLCADTSKSVPEAASRRTEVIR